MAQSSISQAHASMDVVAFGAHPDDVELSAGGTLAKLATQGKRCAIVDLTRGELGTRGSAELRDKEAAASASILGLAHRENLGLADGFFEITEDSLRAVVFAIRRLRPAIVLANALEDRHPDHGVLNWWPARRFSQAFPRSKPAPRTRQRRHGVRAPCTITSKTTIGNPTWWWTSPGTSTPNSRPSWPSALNSTIHSPRNPPRPSAARNSLPTCEGGPPRLGGLLAFCTERDYEVRRPMGVESLLDLA